MESNNDSAIAPWSVLHLFCGLDEGHDPSAIELAIKACESAGNTVITAAMFGHKADLGVMALGPNDAALRQLQSSLAHSGTTLRYSYFSRTEVSEYAPHLEAPQLEARLHPQLPPADKPAFCFYPMSKRRLGDDNWYRLDYDARRAFMIGHGALGRTFHGRVVQLITGSTGLDEYEWGVTLFATTPDDLKACVYEMRFDEASARFAEFGPFLTGTTGTVREVLTMLGVA